jgi:patatin-like phospholipase/acyl hydrolase
LNVLQQKTGNANIAQDADMLAGTSTGSSIVAALARKKDRAPETAAELINFFRTSELKFFKNQNYLVSKPGYDVKDIAADMELKYLGIKLKDLPQRVLMTAFNVGDAAKKIDWQPVLFHNFPFSTVSETPLADAVVSSGAMPGMLGSHKGNVDGAFVHHDPTLAAIALAVRGGHKLSDIVVICFGTGFMGNSLGKETANWGAYQWQHGTPDDPNPDYYHLQPLLVNGSISPILNISLNGTSTNLVPDLSGMMLADPQLGSYSRYAYLNPKLKGFIPENEYNLDVLDYLQEVAEHTVDFTKATELVTKYWV